jgi:hypothetical protein
MPRWSYCIVNGGFAVWADYDDGPSQMKIRVGKASMAVRVGTSKVSSITVCVVCGRGTTVEAWDFPNGTVRVYEV